jgi:PAS domain-containing protein
MFFGRGERCQGCPVSLAMADGEPHSTEMSAGGMEILHRAYPVKDAQGRLLGTAAFILDITDRKREEEALRESEARRSKRGRRSHAREERSRGLTRTARSGCRARASPGPSHSLHPTDARPCGHRSTPDREARLSCYHSLHR